VGETRETGQDRAEWGGIGDYMGSRLSAAPRRGGDHPHGAVQACSRTPLSARLRPAELLQPYTPVIRPAVLLQPYTLAIADCHFATYEKKFLVLLD
jgi:hypothetical protein